MSENANHHFVPQFYFKQFNGGRRQICALLTKQGRVIPCASIKGQCARHKFYGSPEIEQGFSELEGLHAVALRSLIEAARAGDERLFSGDSYPWLLQAVVFQRARTMLEVQKGANALKKLALELFQDHFQTEHPSLIEEFKAAVECGKAHVAESPTEAVFRQIEVALESAPLLSDMLISVIRNHTDYPFVFSDSPVVFYNSYCGNVTERGVLGVQSPGLQIFWPLTSTLQLMMIDRNAYTGRFREGPFCDVTDRCDVSQLNALQMHHSSEAVYFADPKHSDYVVELFRAHRPCFKKPETVLRIQVSDQGASDLSADKHFHEYEPQLNHNLSLSFVGCKPLPARGYRRRHRSPQIVAEHRRFYSEHYDGTDA